MLVLTRKVNEKLVITDSNGVELVVTVCKTKGNYVTLGIEGPKSIRVRREELLAKPLAA